MQFQLPLSLFLLSLAACGGGSSSAGGATVDTTGSVYVAIDTAAGTDALVQFQVGAAQLERADGTRTDNLLAASAMVTLASPTGELDGLSLRHVPSGEYANLHLILVPGSGFARYADGSEANVQSPVDVAVPIAERLSHDANGRSFLSIGHNGASLPAGGSSSVVWTPDLAGRSDGAPQSVDSLKVLLVQGQTVTATWSRADDAPIEVSFAAGCELFDDNSPGNSQVGSSGEFTQGLSGSDDLVVEGELHRNGTLVAHRAHRRHGGDDPRLIGRIVELRPATQSFVFDVQAEVHHHGMQPQSGAVQVLVQASQAELQTHGTHQPLQFGDLQTGQLAKVEFTSRTQVPGSLDEVVAREVEVGSSSGSPLQPEWEGAVQSVDVVGGTITVVPRGNDPIVIGGVTVTSATVAVGAGTSLVRRGSQGASDTAIGLGDIVAGQDRIWWRGTVSGPSTVDATWVRVRDDG